VAPVVNQRVAETTVEMESGQTFVLAGLTRNQTSVSADRIPILADLPLFGWAFQQKTYNQIEEELIIMVTPYFADALNERPCKLPGREGRIPNDIEWYLGSKYEPPCFDDPYVGDWKKGWTAPEVKPVPPYDNWGRPESSFVYPQQGGVNSVELMPFAPPPALKPGMAPPPKGTTARPQSSTTPAVSRPLTRQEPPPLGSALWNRTDGRSVSDPVKPPATITETVSRRRAPAAGPAILTDDEAVREIPATRREVRRRSSDSGTILSVQPRDGEPSAPLALPSSSDQSPTNEDGWRPVKRE
jgi:hypothetical protein